LARQRLVWAEWNSCSCPRQVPALSHIYGMKSDWFKGYLFAAIATIAFFNIYIFSKAALNEVHLAHFGVYWFFIAIGVERGLTF
tara:strand:+ start:317 stop:568 length:252 start_codon:yes stop_codon:yes gene_type:complete